jgi:HEAT repeat protein
MKIKLPKMFAKKGFVVRVKPKPAAARPPEPVADVPEDTDYSKRTTPALIASLGHADPYMRTVAAEVLGRLREKQSVQPLITALRDHSKLVREKTAIALGHIGDKNAVQPLIESLNDEAEEVRVTVAGVLGHLRDRAAVPALITSLSAAISLGLIGDPLAIKPLFDALSDENEMVRKYACEALGSLGRPAVPALLKALKNDRVRAHAAHSLMRVK